MARIELRHATILIQDGLSGTAVVAANTANTDTDMDINTVNLNTDDTDLVPVGARFTVNTVNNTTTYTVTGRTPTATSPTTNITFTPAISDGAPGAPPLENDIVTFLPSRIEVKVGEGNLTWSEAKEYEYLLDRGDLDTVKEGDEQPLELSLEFVYEYVLTGTGEAITPVDAVKGSGGAAEWVSSSADPCEPYAVDLIVLHCVPCGGDEDERIEFPDFRYESLEFDLGEATISVSGRCNASEPTITRSNDSECA